MRVYRYLFLVVIALLTLKGIVRADLFDTYGIDAQGLAMAGARCASVDDLSALYYNPAGLGKMKGHALGLSYLVAHPNMDVTGATTSVQGESDLSLRSVIITLGLDINQLIDIPKKVTFAFGLSMMDDGTMVRLEDLEEQEFSYIQYGSSLTRSIIYMGLGVEAIPDFLYVGVGAHAMIGGDVAATMTLDAQDLSTTQQVIPSEQYFWMKMKMKLYPTLGIIVQPTKDLKLGLSYRDGIKVELDPFLADIALTLGSHAAHINAYTAISSFWQPKSYQAGLSYQLEDITLEGDITYDRWSEFERSVPREMRRLAPSFDDVLSYRLGLEYRLPSLTVWTGYQFAPSPVPKQTGGAHYLDADRHIVGLGAGTTYKDPWGLLRKPLGLSLGIQDQLLPKRTFQSSESSYAFKGNVICGIASLKLAF